MTSVILCADPDLDRLAKLLDVVAEVAPDLDPGGQPAGQLAEIVERCLGLSCVETGRPAMSGADSVELVLVPSLSEQDWRFLIDLASRRVSGPSP